MTAMDLLTGEQPTGHGPAGPARDERPVERTGAFVSPPLRRRRRRRWLLPAAIAAVLLGAVATRRLILPPVPVEAVAVVAAPMKVELAGPGTLEAKRLARVGFRIAGRIVALDADVGDSVAEGQLLARVDDGDLAAAFDNARSAEAADRVGVDAAVADERSAGATLVQARADHDRSERLVGNGVSSVAENQKLATAVTTAEAALARATASRREAEARAAAGGATVREASAKLADARIAAPFAGLVVARSAGAGDSVGANAVVFEIVDPASLYVEARFDETLLADLAVGEAATVTLRSDRAVRIAGRIARMSRAVDADTREVTVEIALDRVPATWAVGQRADVSVVVRELQSALAVPTAAVFWRNGESYVWLDVAGRAHRAVVVTGASGPSTTEIVKGIRPGDEVLLSDDLAPLRRVEVRR